MLVLHLSLASALSGDQRGKTPARTLDRLADWLLAGYLLGCVSRLFVSSELAPPCSAVIRMAPTHLTAFVFVKLKALDWAQGPDLDYSVCRERRQAASLCFQYWAMMASVPLALGEKEEERITMIENTR